MNDNAILIGGGLTIAVVLAVVLFASKSDTSSSYTPTYNNSTSNTSSNTIYQASSANKNDVIAAGITAGGGLLASIVGLFAKKDD